MNASNPLKTLLAGLATVAVVGTAIAQSNPPSTASPNAATGAGQQSSQNTPMGTTGTGTGASGTGTTGSGSTMGSGSSSGTSGSSGSGMGSSGASGSMGSGSTMGSGSSDTGRTSGRPMRADRN